MRFAVSTEPALAGRRNAMANGIVQIIRMSCHRNVRPTDRHRLGLVRDAVEISSSVLPDSVSRVNCCAMDEGTVRMVAMKW